MAYQSRSRKASESDYDISKKIQDQTYWVDQVKKNPNDFNYYLENKIVKNAHHREILDINKRKRSLSALPNRKNRPITAHIRSSHHNRNFYSDSGSQCDTWQEIKGPVEQYSEMLEKNKSYSKRHSDLANRRQQIKEKEIEHREQLKLLLEKRMSNVERNKKRLAKIQKNVLSIKITKRDQALEKCEKVALSKDSLNYQKSLAQSRDMEEFYKHFHIKKFANYSIDDFEKLALDK